MITLHWIWILVIASVSGTAGFMLCAMLTMAKQSDEAMEKMRPGPHTGYDHKSDWPGKR